MIRVRTSFSASAGGRLTVRVLMSFAKQQLGGRGGGITTSYQLIVQSISFLFDCTLYHAI
jgi:hypothetical protein